MFLLGKPFMLENTRNGRRQIKQLTNLLIID